MRFYRPQSFFILLLTGFLFVSLPLLTALITSFKILDSMVLQSVVAVYSSVDRMSKSRKIADLLQDQERKTRLYNVLGEPAQLQEVNKIHEEIEEALNTFATFNNNKELTQLIEELKSRERYIIAVLNRTSGGPEQHKGELVQTLSQYKRIGDLTMELVKSTNQLTYDSVEELKLKVARDKRQLVWQTSGLIGFSVLFIVMFMALISRPIRQINQGIERLGDGNFLTPVKVSGPRDLEDLGQKLDWLRKRLAKLDREKVKLVAHISHDLKTPLASIKEGAGLLRDELVGTLNSRQREVITILDKNCTKLQALIENIVNFNMAKARQIPKERQRIALDELITEVIADHRNASLARNIQLEARLVNAPVSGDPKQLKIVFDNLLANAVKFTPDDGVIRIRMQTDGKIVVCLVEDSGLGIDEEERSRIFSPFFRGKRSEKSVVKGSGLGLAISKEYVEYHGGSIRALPNKQGARFMVTLPVTGETA